MYSRLLFQKLYIPFVALLSASLLLLLLLLLPSSPSLAQDNELRREEMIEIAERYVAHPYTTTVTNVLHDIGIDTPNREYYSNWPSWMGWVIGDNVGVPYQWGGWSALGDQDLLLMPDDDGRYFDEQLRLGYPAGDINITNYYRNAAGVDCSGLVSRAWRTKDKYGSSRLKEMSRPIQFKDLRPGDLLYLDGHVMLFKMFVNEEIKETINETRIKVIEASSIDWKVNEREYTLTAIESETEFWGGRRYDTNTVTLTHSGVTLQNVSPRTYLNPIDVVLVIDRSGSMSTEKMQAAKNAAKFFVDQVRIGDKIGVVDFDNIITVTYPLTETKQTGTQKTGAKNAIDSLYARGLTSIGGGLQAGQNQLNTLGLDSEGNEDPVHVMILLSDGGENTAPDVAGVLPGIVTDEIVVYTVGLGSGANETLLKDIADQTGGIYRYSSSPAGLWDIYNSILIKVYGQTVVRRAFGMVAPGGTVEEQVWIDSTIGQATFALSWPGSDLDLVLVRPDESIVDPAVAETDPLITFVSGTTYEFYQVDAPQDGEWTLRIHGTSTPPEGEEYSISVFASDAMIFSVEADQTEYPQGSPIKITASIEDSFLDVVEHQYILGVTMQVAVEDPALNSYTFELYDDGLHGDGGADDGIYASTFTNTSLVGSYNFDLSVSGANLRDGQPFTREYSFSTLVIEAPQGLIFADGFESGDLSAWSEVVTDEDDLSVTAQAAMAGANGMQAQIDDITAIFVRDNTPDLETTYQASFTFDPNSVAMESGESFSFFLAYSPQGEIALSAVKLILGFDGENYYLRAGVMDDEGWYAYLTPPTTVSDEPHTVAVEWQAASTEGANDGRFAFSIDGAPIADYSDIDNDTNRIDFALLGTIGGIDAGTSGIAYFDDFTSSRVIQGGALAALSRGESLDFPVEDEFKTVDILPISEK